MRGREDREKGSHIQKKKSTQCGWGRPKLKPAMSAGQQEGSICKGLIIQPQA